MSLTWYHIVWLLLPLFFILMALWSKLEMMSGRPRRDHPSDILNQAIFVLFAVIVCILLDKYVLTSVYESVVPDWIPLGLLRFLLLPAVLLAAAMAFGPSNDIRITQAPRPTKSKDSKGKK
ncbi:MAG: hypothetical protein J5J00_17140 [Deltaproteobacteria bacterium]|nr:hypothetical protein [Deltaproteobacteria bacterium]